MKSRYLTLAAKVAAVAGILAIALPVLAQNGDEAGKKLQGSWTGWVVERRGERPDRGPAKITEVAFNADKITARDDTMSLGEGTLVLDPKNPKNLDSVATAGQSKGRRFLGIYTLEGDTLKWCVANAGRPRPRDFFTQGPNQFLMILKRVPQK
jgi:uncharacterized protein (TIGR03067 family)